MNSASKADYVFAKFVEPSVQFASLCICNFQFTKCFVRYCHGRLWPVSLTNFILLVQLSY